ATRCDGRGRDGAGDEGVGERAWRDAFHALVPAVDGHDGGEARLVHHAERGWWSGLRVQWQGPGAGRAGRVVVSKWRAARDVRGTWLYGVGSELAGVHRGDAERLLPVDPDRIRVVDGRRTRYEDPAAALAQCGGREGTSCARVVRRGRARGQRDARAGAGVLP